jgi:hypothetical protein
MFYLFQESPHRKKSGGVRSGDLGCERPCPMMQSPKNLAVKHFLCSQCASDSVMPKPANPFIFFQHRNGWGQKVVIICCIVSPENNGCRIEILNTVYIHTHEVLMNIEELCALYGSF